MQSVVSSSSADLIQRFRVLGLYKQLYKRLALNPTASSVAISAVQSQKDGSSTGASQTTKSSTSRLAIAQILRDEFRQNNVSDSRYCMQKNELFFLGNAYLTYLRSTEETLSLYATYCKGERSIESSAAIVGLRLPKLYINTNPTESNKEWDALRYILHNTNKCSLYWLNWTPYY